MAQTGQEDWGKLRRTNIFLVFLSEENTEIKPALSFLESWLSLNKTEEEREKGAFQADAAGQTDWRHQHSSLEVWVVDGGQSMQPGDQTLSLTHTHVPKHTERVHLIHLPWTSAGIDLLSWALTPHLELSLWNVLQCCNLDDADEGRRFVPSLLFSLLSSSALKLQPSTCPSSLVLSS